MLKKLLLFSLLMYYNSQAQCTATNFVGSVIADNSGAGFNVVDGGILNNNEYSIVTELNLNDTYSVVAPIGMPLITIINPNDDSVIAFGSSGLMFTAITNNVEVHFFDNTSCDTSSIGLSVVVMQNSSLLSLYEFDLSNQITIYPNPTKGVTNIGSSLLIDSIQVYDLKGREIEKHYNRFNDLDFKLDLDNYMNGLYILNISFSNGQKILHKLIKI